jgi:hypothetical protein
MTSKRTKSSKGQPNVDTGSNSAQSARIRNASKSVRNIVKDAADILDEEVASGIVAARQVQDRFKKEKRIDPKDFEGALQKFNTDAHEVLTLVGKQIDELGSRENAEMTKRLMGKTHEVLDLAIEMVNIGATLANELLQKNTKPTGAGSGNGAS